METMEILKLAVMIIVGYFILKFIWNAVGGVIKLIVVVLLVAVGTYLYDKELVYGLLGKENTEQIIDKSIQVANDGLDEVKEFGSEVAEEALDSPKEKGEEIVEKVVE